MYVYPISFGKLLSWLVSALFYGLKSIGLAPFSIQTKTRVVNCRNTYNKVFLFSRMGMLYNLVLAIAMTTMGGLATSSIIAMEYPNKSLITQGLDVIHHVLYVSTSSFIIAYLAFGQNKAVIVMNRLLDVHFLLSGAEEQLFNKRMCVSLSSQIAFFVFLWSTVVFTGASGNFFFKPVMVIQFLISTFFLQYSNILRIVAREFEILNQNLSNFRDFPNFLFRTTLQSRRSTLNLKLLHTVRTTLFELSQDVADLFSLPILFCIACFFLDLVYDIYFMIMPILISIREVPLTVRINSLTWIVIVIFSLVLLCFHVSETEKKAKLTWRVVHTLLATARDGELIAELEQFSLELIHEDVRFTAHGFFDLNFTLIQSILGATVTYLIIMIQFVGSGNRDKD